MPNPKWRADFASRTRLAPGQDAFDAAQLTVTVLFTSREGALAALQQAAEMADELGANIRILVPQIVPYPLPLKFPTVDFGFTSRRLQTMFQQSPIPTRVEVFLCRDLSDCLAQGLEERSIVLIGGRKRWWPTRETRLAKTLTRLGHHALLIMTNTSPP